MTKEPKNYCGSSLTVMDGIAKNFKSISEPGNRANPPIMVHAETQTTAEDFVYLNTVDHFNCTIKKEKALEEKMKALEETLRESASLFTQMHNTSLETSRLLSPEEPSPPLHNNISYNNSDKSNNNGAMTPSPKIVNAINYNQHESSLSKNYIIAQDTQGEIQLAQAEEEASNLNSSAESGRLEICLPPEENVQNADLNTPKNTMALNQLYATSLLMSRDCIIKKPKFTRELQERLTMNPEYYNDKPKENIVLNTPKNIQGTKNNNYVHKQGNDDEFMISIGPNKTCVSSSVYNNINWNSHSSATRALLVNIFGRHTLATHSMTGKPSPAFKNQNKPIKKRLDPSAVADIIHAVSRNCKVSEKDVRFAITTKCADENKIMKSNMKKHELAKQDENKEN